MVGRSEGHVPGDGLSDGNGTRQRTEQTDGEQRPRLEVNGSDERRPVGNEVVPEVPELLLDPRLARER